MPLRSKRDLAGERGVERLEDALARARQAAGERQVVRGVVRAKHGVRGLGPGDEAAQLPQQPLDAGKLEAATLLELRDRHSGNHRQCQ